MALYRQTSTGFLCEFASNPGSGYTAVPAQPTTNITERVIWWRGRDVDAALGQSSVWHPSLQGGMEAPKPPGTAGSGINIMPPRYSTFEEPGGLPPLVVSGGVTVSRLSGGYHGGYKLRVTTTSPGQAVVFAPTSITYAVKLVPNLRWIFSLYCAMTGGSAITIRPTLRVLNYPAGPEYTDYTFDVTTGTTQGKWERLFGAYDTRLNNGAAAQLYIRFLSACTIDFDGLMLEELIGDTVKPSAYYAPPTTVDDSQITSVSVDKLTAGTIEGEEVILSGSGAVLRSSNYVPGSSGFCIRGDGYAEFRNVTVRGSLNAADIVAGYINGARFGNDTIGGGPIMGGAIHAYRYSNINGANFPSINSSSIIPSSYWSPALSFPANSNRSGILLMASFQPNYAGNRTSDSYWFGAFGRPINSPLAYSTRAIAAPSNGTFVLAASGSLLFWDAYAGTGSLSYYFAGHQYINSSSMPFSGTFIAIEFSKA